ncbi:2-oxoglutarate dehydrogenase, E2 component, dihydrolipoamide succinyltransferase [Actinotignum urinale]|uniref:Dihydrolipoamide acetyltransferase component of pyruvate dehydrogenase complex n=1 Tax=Actinotignum urinale TaxID=190146 RepID=A0ABU5G4V2_9ACTO|nr:2-oxoglutarate dehydrogenase, E2 component, dihydrolipoamide succinyltransferase [Actinotignum urinale]MDY5132197.1 2-oxoglutarate dehydrogenase, E2 component, dihydrolipoamide succinyltransferase [Actinotignum urinale]MDY5151966.1 2-oxoglutarate dehydrogenase, E2 component, dihydrolipoamide succinyltransferase [Actinotignum urinale]
MSEPIKMPALGESVTTGTVTAWLKEVGDTVSLDEPIVEVSTDKVDSEVPSPAEGVLEQILVQEDEEVEVGTVLAYIGDGSGVATSAPAPATVAEPAPEPAPVAPVAPAPAPATAGVEVKMPALGESVNEGTVTSWLVAEGDTVEEGDPIVEVSTDKVDSEVPAPASGVLQKIMVQEDETVAVDTVIALIGDGAAPAAPAPAAPAPVAAPTPAPAPAAPAPVAAPVAPAARATGYTEPDAYITPIVRKLAKDLNVDLSNVQGSGVGGRIRRQDVEEAAAKAKAVAAAAATPAPVAPAPAPAKKAPVAPSADAAKLRGTTQKMTRLRQVIASRMVESLQTSAQLTTVIKVDVTKLVKIREANKADFQKREATKLTYLPFFVKAAVDTLKNHPKLNATIKDKDVEYFDYENIGIAVDTPKGLFVPVIKNAGDLNIAGIARQINSLAAKVREGSAGADELTGGTFTITNTGSNGVMFDTPVLNMPEVAILGIGGIMREPGIVKDADGNETIGIRSYLYPAITYDHRLVDGADAGRFLKDFKKRVEEADFLGDL